MVSPRAHATRSAYVAGCRCRPCTDAHNLYVRTYANARRHPEIYAPVTMLDAAPFALLVQSLLAGGGYTRKSLAKAVGLTPRCIGDLAHARYPRIQRRTVNALARLLPDQQVIA